LENIRHNTILIIIDTVLAQLVIKTIYLLENAGTMMDEFVSDGATSNRKLWPELGVSGEKDNLKKKFDYPLDNKRCIYVFYDAPYLLKNVQNRLCNKKSLRVNML